jgi:hypothetical protein
MTKDDFHWLIGILEGEGCFSIQRQAKRRPYAIIALNTTDPDVAERVRRLVRAPAVNGYDRGTNKRLYQVKIYNVKAKTLMVQLLPYMSERRQARIREVLAST